MKLSLLALQACLFTAAHAADAPRLPMEVLRSVADQIYSTGETSGSPEVMIAAERKAAEEIRAYITSGATEGLLAKEKGAFSPLATAAYQGYPDVVAALLTSPQIKSHINDADENGLTPWMAANFSMKQSAWACNPAIFADPFRFIPMFVTQPYYLSKEAPYQRTRELLEKAGARADVAQARQIWLKSCTSQSAQTKANVGAATDLLTTIQAEGLSVLQAHLSKLQGK